MDQGFRNLDRIGRRIAGVDPWSTIGNRGDLGMF
jgi:hypothetical protein